MVDDFSICIDKAAVWSAAFLGFVILEHDPSFEDSLKAFAVWAFSIALYTPEQHLFIDPRQIQIHRPAAFGVRTERLVDCIDRPEYLLAQFPLSQLKVPYLLRQIGEDIPGPFQVRIPVGDKEAVARPGKCRHASVGAALHTDILPEILPAQIG